MLELNPYFRPSAKQLLKNPIFDSLRVSSNEKTSPYTVKLSVDSKEQMIDYEKCNFKAELNSKLMKAIIKETMKLNKQ